MIDTQAEFLMEVTDKTKADIKVRLLSVILLLATKYGLAGWYSH